MNVLAPLRVLIADDHALIREGFAALLTPEAGFCVVGVACNGEETVRLFRQHTPDVLLMDVRMPVLDGLSATKILRHEFPNARIILLSTFNNNEAVYQATRIGVKSYLLKDAPNTELLQALRLVAAGETYFPPQITEMLMQRLSQPPLTTREQEILACLATGKSNGEIAAALFIAEGTVKSHMNNLYAKMGVADRTQAVTEGIKRGLVTIP